MIYKIFALALPFMVFVLVSEIIKTNKFPYTSIFFIVAGIFGLFEWINEHKKKRLWNEIKKRIDWID